jgi:hypothetical protein
MVSGLCIQIESGIKLLRVFFSKIALWRSISIFACVHEMNKDFWKEPRVPHCLFHTFVFLRVPYYFIWIYEDFILTKHLFIIPTDTHNYKIMGMLKTIKITSLLCKRAYRHNIDHVFNDEHNIIIIVVLAKHEIVPWWWFLLEPKHVGTFVRILIVFNILMVL